MAKSVFRVLTIRHIFVGKDKEENMSKQNTVPEPPTMCWNPDGSPCFKHLTGEQDTKPVHRRNIDKNQLRVPKMPRMRWRANGEPDYSHL